MGNEECCAGVCDGGNERIHRLLGERRLKGDSSASTTSGAESHHQNEIW